jgi:hypothetical protein
MLPSHQGALPLAGQGRKLNRRVIMEDKDDFLIMPKPCTYLDRRFVGVEAVMVEY